MSEFGFRHPAFKWLSAAVALVVLGLILWSVAGLFSPSHTKAKAAPKLTLVPDRPPPPPPKPEEKRPEPPKSEQREMKLDQPRDVPRQAPSESLKMEGMAGDGPSAFQSGSVGNEDLSRAGAGDFAGNGFAIYAQGLKRRLEQSLAKVNALRGFPYRVEVRVWIGAAGAISRAELVDSTGNPEVDALLRSALREVPALADVPPNGMPQPVRLRLISS